MNFWIWEFVEECVKDLCLRRYMKKSILYEWNPSRMLHKCFHLIRKDQQFCLCFFKRLPSAFGTIKFGIFGISPIFLKFLVEKGRAVRILFIYRKILLKSWNKFFNLKLLSIAGGIAKYLFAIAWNCLKLFEIIWK